MYTNTIVQFVFPSKQSRSIKIPFINCLKKVKTQIYVVHKLKRLLRFVTVLYKMFRERKFPVSLSKHKNVKNLLGVFWSKFKDFPSINIYYFLFLIKKVRHPFIQLSLEKSKHLVFLVANQYKKGRFTRTTNKRCTLIKM